MVPGRNSLALELRRGGLTPSNARPGAARSSKRIDKIVNLARTQLKVRTMRLEVKLACKCPPIRRFLAY